METPAAASFRVSDVVGRLDANYSGDAGAANESQNRFGLMLVHDGYQNLDQLIEDLKSCGYPDNTEVLLLSAAELFRAPLHLLAGNYATNPETLAWRPERSTYWRTYACGKKLTLAALQARAKILAAFPTWKVTFDQPLGWQANLIVIGTNHNSLLNNRGLAEMIRKITSESMVPFRVVGVHSQDDAFASQADCPMAVIGTAPQVQCEELRPQVANTWMKKPHTGTAAAIRPTSLQQTQDSFSMSDTSRVFSE